MLGSHFIGSTPANSNDGNYATLLISDFEWNPAQALEWSNDPTDWGESSHFLQLYTRLGPPEGHVPCLNTDADLRSRVGVNAALQSRVGVNCRLQERVGVDLGLCDKEDAR
jgi:hypothetical protein